MQTITTSPQTISSNVAPATENRIIARVVLQVWGGRKGNDAIFDCEKNVDVTDAVLLLDHDLLIKLQDATDQADEIGHAHVNHSGPLEVYVTSSICQFFGVDSMKEITLAALEEARRVVNPKRPEYVRMVVQMEVAAKVLPGGNRATALNDLSIEVSSPSANVIVTQVQRMRPEADGACALPVLDSELRRFLRLMALANAVSINDGAILTAWTTSPFTGEPTNEVLRFAWTDGKLDYSVTLTEEGIDTGTFDDTGRFFTNDVEGDLIAVRFFTLNPIGQRSLRAHH